MSYALLQVGLEFSVDMIGPMAFVGGAGKALSAL